MEDCRSCKGTGIIDIGDCEDGVTDICPACHGEGQIDYDLDEFVPARDAFMPGD